MNRRKFHKYLGMTLDYSTFGQVKITMLDYIDEILDTFYKSYPIGGGNNSIAAPYIIFKVDEDCKELMPNKLWSFIAQAGQSGHLHRNFFPHYKSNIT